MLIFAVLILGCAALLYSVLFFDVPLPKWVRNGMAGMRIVFLLILLYLLMYPTFAELVSSRLTPTLYIALDDSHSMSYPVYPMIMGEDEPSRWEQLRSSLENEGILDSWRDKGFQLRFGNFSDIAKFDRGGWHSSPRFSIDPLAPQTDISSVIQSFEQQSKRDESSYLMLFSDGQVTRGGSPVGDAARVIQSKQDDGSELDFRVYSFGIGTTDEVFDLLVESFFLPSDIRAGDALQSDITLAYRGEKPAAALSLRVKGESVDGTVVYDETFPVEFESSNEKNITLTLPELPEGEYQFSADFVLLENELFDENNTAKRGVCVRESKDRVLILTSAPTWDSKYLKRALENHPSIEAHSYFLHDNGISFLGDPDQTQVDSAENRLPVYEDIESLQQSLSSWSVIVLSNFYFQLGYKELAEGMKSYVENGGGVVVLPGQYNSAPPAGEVVEILPSVLQRVYVPMQQSIVVTADDAEQSPLLSQISDEQKQNLIPLMTWYRNVKPDQSMAAGQTLLQGRIALQQSFPLMEIVRVGLGRVIIGYTDSFWRWGMMMEDEILPVFWVSAVYQSQPRLLSTAGEIYTDRFTYTPYQPVEIEYSIRETIRDATASNLALQVNHDEKTERIWLEADSEKENVYRGSYTPLQSGEYSISTIGGEAKTTFSVEASLEELRDLRQDIQTLREIANAGGGGYANQPAWKTMAERVPLSTQLRTETVNRFLGEKWWMISLLVFLLGLEWFTRWRQGLP